MGALPVVCCVEIAGPMTLFDGNYFTELRFPLVSRCAKCNIAPYIFENCSRGKRNALRGWNCTSGAFGVGLFQLAGTGTPGRGRRRRRRPGRGIARWSRRAPFDRPTVERPMRGPARMPPAAPRAGTTASRAAARPSARASSASRGTAATAPARAPAKPVRRRCRWARARWSRPASSRPIRAIAMSRRTRPAGRTEPATAREAAASIQWALSAPPGTCQGAEIGGTRVCDGSGACRAGAINVCAPFLCSTTTNKCKTTCTADADCVSPIKCLGGSCGPKPPGAACGARRRVRFEALRRRRLL